MFNIRVRVRVHIRKREIVQLFSARVHTHATCAMHMQGHQRSS